MRYVMKEKWLALGNDFTITNERKEPLYYVDGRVLSLGNKLSFQDMSGRELAFIRQRLLSWGPTYEVTSEGQLVATVRKKIFTFFHCKFSVDVPGPDDLEARGDFFDHEYQFQLHGRPVAEVSKKWIAWKDTYAIDVSTDANHVLILCCAVVIDLCCHEEQHNRH
jgi:uncharacterized protein YxjI